MLRWLSSILILCIAFGSVDAATDVESLGGCDDQSPHEVHGELQDLLPDGNPEHPAPPEGAQPLHFCHCAVHAPAMPSSVGLIAGPAAQLAPSIPTYLCGTSRTPPPVRPPKLD